MSSNNSPAQGAADDHGDNEITQLINVDIYDTHSSSTILKVNSSIRSIDICRAIAHKIDLSSDDAKQHDLVLVVTMTLAETNTTIHCLRTLKPQDFILETLGNLMSKLLDKHNPNEDKRFKSAIRWFYKDQRTSPIDIGDSGEVSGDYSSDEDDPISHSDLAYLAKAERKGYLLKKSSKDPHLWRRWYCVLTDHLWCIDINKEVPRAICIRLSGMVRQKDKHISLQTLQCIIINSLKQTHFFRAFNLQEQQKWVDELMMKTGYATDNDYFSMAEFIMGDEETSKSLRMQKQIDESCLLDEMVSSGGVGTLASTIPAITALTITSSRNTCNYDKSGCRSAYNRNEIRKSNGSTSHSSSTSSRNSDIDSSPASSGIMSVQQQQQLLQGNTLFTTGTTTVNATVAPSFSVRSAIGFQRPFPSEFMAHKWHEKKFRATDILTFIVEAQKYKELFRHDLFVTERQLQMAAIVLYSKYILPQLHVLGERMPTEDLEAANGLLLRAERLNMFNSRGSGNSSHQRVITTSDGTFNANNNSYRINSTSNSRHSRNAEKVSTIFPVYNIVMNRRRAASNAAATALAERSLYGQKKHTRDPNDIVSWGIPKEFLLNVHKQLFNSKNENDNENGEGVEGGDGDSSSSGNNSMSTPLPKSSVATRVSVHSSPTAAAATAAATTAAAAATTAAATTSTGGYWTSWYRSAISTPVTSPVPATAAAPGVAGGGSFSEKHFARLQFARAELFDDVVGALATTVQQQRQQHDEQQGGEQQQQQQQQEEQEEEQEEEKEHVEDKQQSEQQQEREL